MSRREPPESTEVEGPGCGHNSYHGVKIIEFAIYNSMRISFSILCSSSHVFSHHTLVGMSRRQSEKWGAPDRVIQHFAPVTIIAPAMIIISDNIKLELG